MPLNLSVGGGNSSREKGACSSPGQSQFVVPDQWVDNEWGGGKFSLQGPP